MFLKEHSHKATHERIRVLSFKYELMQSVLLSRTVGGLTVENVMISCIFLPLQKGQWRRESLTLSLLYLL